MCVLGSGLIRTTYQKLLEMSGFYDREVDNEWWPRIFPHTERNLEIILGMILVQRAKWDSGAEKSLRNLNNAGLNTLRAINDARIEIIEVVIKPSGFYIEKAKLIKDIVKLFSTQYDANISKFFEQSLIKCRSELLKIKGIGLESADTILLYAGMKPVFPIDSYTRRLVNRLGMANEKASYKSLQELFENAFSNQVLDDRIKSFQILHASIVEHGQHICYNKKRPNCDNCTLRFECNFNNSH